MHKKVPYPEATKPDSLQFWSSIRRPIKNIAIELFSIKSSSSNDERLFSFLGWCHTARRNRLEVSMLEKLAKLRYFYAQGKSIGAAATYVPKEIAQHDIESIFESRVWSVWWWLRICDWHRTWNPDRPEYLNFDDVIQELSTSSDSRHDLDIDQAVDDLVSSWLHLHLKLSI